VRLQFPAHLLDQLLDHRSAFRTAFLEKPLQALLRVGALTEILRHVILLRGLPHGNVAVLVVEHVSLGEGGLEVGMRRRWSSSHATPRNSPLDHTPSGSAGRPCPHHQPRMKPTDTTQNASATTPAPR